MSQGRDGVVTQWQVHDGGMSSVSSIFTESCSFGRASLIELPTGSMLAAPGALDPSMIAVWDIQSNQIAHFLGTPSDKLGLCMVIKALADPFVVYAGYENGGLYCWDVRTQQILFSKILHSEPLLCFDVEQSTNKVISGSADTKLVISQMNLETMALSTVGQIDIPNAGIHDVKVRPHDKKIVATAGWDHRVRIFSWKTGKALANLQYHTKTVYAVDFSRKETESGGYLLASSSEDSKIALWSIYQ